MYQQKPVYRPPVFDQELFRSNFVSLKAPIKDRFRIKPVPADVLKLSSRQVIHLYNSHHLDSDSNESEKNMAQMDFIDKNLELEMGWAINPIRERSSN